MIGSIRLVAFHPTGLLFLASKGVLLDLEVVAVLELFETYVVRLVLAGLNRDRLSVVYFFQLGELPSFFLIKMT